MLGQIGFVQQSTQYDGDLWTPAQILSKIIIWIDPANTTVTSSGGEVLTLLDRGPNEYTFYGDSRAPASGGPFYDTQVNGQNVLRYTAEPERRVLRTNNGGGGLNDNINLTVLNSASSSNIFFIGEHDNTISHNAYLQTVSNGASLSQVDFRLSGTPPNDFFHRMAGDVRASRNNFVLDPAFSLMGTLTMPINGSSGLEEHEVRYNGEVIPPGTDEHAGTGTNFNTTNDILLGYVASAGAVGSVIHSPALGHEGVTYEHIWAFDLTQEEKNKIEGYTHHKFNLQNLLPPGHPYKNSPPTTQ